MASGKTIFGLGNVLLGGQVANPNEVYVGVDDNQSTLASKKFPVAEMVSYLAGAGLTPHPTNGINLDLNDLLQAFTVNDTDWLVIQTVGGNPQKITKANFQSFVAQYVHPNHTGDVTSVADGPTTIAAGAVTTAKIADAQVTRAKLAADAITDLAIAGTATSVSVEATQTGTGPKQLPIASGSVAGLLSAADYVRFGASNEETPERHGAVGNGVADDTAAVQAAINTGRPVLLSTYRVTARITVPANCVVRGNAIAKLVGDHEWQNDALLEITGNSCRLSGFTIEEAAPSPTDPGKAGQTNNCGLRISSSGNIVRDVKVVGFTHPILLRNTAGTAALDRNALENVEASFGHAWGIEVNSARELRLSGSRFFHNGQSGIRVLNDYSRTPDGLRLEFCSSFDNGRRDTAAQGQENIAGHGINLRAGGFKFALVGCRFNSNYGSGLLLDGAAPQPETGRGSAVSCDFADNLATSLGESHGIEIGTGGSASASWLHFIGGSASGNAGDGVRAEGGTGVTLANMNVIGNLKEGLHLRGCFDVAVQSCRILGNLGTFGIRVGAANTGTFISRRIAIRDTAIHGNYDPSIADSADHVLSDAEIVTKRGIQIQSDSADVTIADVTIANVRDYGILNHGDQVHVKRARVIRVPPLNGIYNSTGAGRITVRDCRLRDLLWRVNFNQGTHSANPAIGVTGTGSVSGATGTLLALVVTSGSFATGDAVGSLYMGGVAGVITATDFVNLSGGGSVKVTSITNPYFIRVLNGSGEVTHNDLSLPAFYSGPNGVYFDDSSSENVVEGNVATNFGAAARLIVENGTGWKDTSINLAATGAVTIDCTRKSRHYLVLTGNTTLTATPPQKQFEWIEIWIQQGGTGDYDITWTGVPLATGGATPVLNRLVGQWTLVRLFWNGSNWILPTSSWG